MNAGIDYGLGRTNIDTATGIRYGVISQGSVFDAWCEESEADYGKACCPKCGNEATDYDSNMHFAYEHKHGGKDYACDPCALAFDSSEAFSDEPLGWNVDDGDYLLTDCLQSDIMVLKSPFYTFAPYCSPCVPGAGNLDSACTERSGVKTYCLGHDWFESGSAPYLVFSVATGLLVIPSTN